MARYDDYSYWLTVCPAPGSAPDTLEKVFRRLKRSSLAVPNGPMVFEIIDDGVSGEIDPRVGVIKEDASLNSIVAAIAKQFPDCDFLFRETNENDDTVAVVTRYKRGTQVYRSRRRTLDPADLDTATIDVVANYLERKGYTALANDIKKNMDQLY